MACVCREGETLWQGRNRELKFNFPQEQKEKNNQIGRRNRSERADRGSRYAILQFCRDASAATETPFNSFIQSSDEESRKMVDYYTLAQGVLDLRCSNIYPPYKTEFPRNMCTFMSLRRSRRACRGDKPLLSSLPLPPLVVPDSNQGTPTFSHGI